MYLYKINIGALKCGPSREEGRFNGSIYRWCQNVGEVIEHTEGCSCYLLANRVTPEQCKVLLKIVNEFKCFFEGIRELDMGALYA